MTNADDGVGSGTWTTCRYRPACVCPTAAREPSTPGRSSTGRPGQYVFDFVLGNVVTENVRLARRGIDEEPEDHPPIVALLPCAGSPAQMGSMERER